MARIAEELPHGNGDQTEDSATWRPDAASVLGNIGGAAPNIAIPALIKLLDDSCARRNAAEALGKLGPAAKASVPLLV